MSRYFTASEFTCRCGREDCDAPKDAHRLLYFYLDRAREMFGFPIIITSGNRCAVHNRAVGGVADSEHVWPEGCLGCDVRASDSRERWKLLDAFRQAGFTRIGFYRDGHLHVGVGDAVDAEKFPPDVAWVT